MGFRDSRNPTGILGIPGIPGIPWESRESRESWESWESGIRRFPLGSFSLVHDRSLKILKNSKGLWNYPFCKFEVDLLKPC